MSNGRRCRCCARFLMLSMSRQVVWWTSRTGESIKVEVVLVGTPVEVLGWMKSASGVSGVTVSSPKI